MGRALFEVSGERRVWRPNHFDTMANFSRCERSEASDVGHKYPHRPITRKRVPLGWGCSSDNMLPTSLSSQAVRDVFGGSAMQVKGGMPRDTPAIRFSVHLKKHAPYYNGAGSRYRQLKWSQQIGRYVYVSRLSRAVSRPTGAAGRGHLARA